MARSTLLHLALGLLSIGVSFGISLDSDLPASAPYTDTKVTGTEIVHLGSTTDPIELKKRGEYAESICHEEFNKNGELWDEVAARCTSKFSMQVTCIRYAAPDNRGLAGVLAIDTLCPAKMVCREFPQTKDWFGKEPHLIDNRAHIFMQSSAYCTPSEPTFKQDVVPPDSGKVCLRTKEVVINGGASTSNTGKTLLVTEEAYNPDTQQHLALQEMSISVSETNKPGSFKPLAVAHGHTGVNLAYGFTAATVFINFCVLLSRLELRHFPRISIHGQVVLAHTFTKPRLESTTEPIELKKRGEYAESICREEFDKNGDLFDEVGARCLNDFTMQVNCMKYYSPTNVALADIRTANKRCPLRMECKEFPQTKDWFGKAPHLFDNRDHIYGGKSAYCTPRRPTFEEDVVPEAKRVCLKTREVVVQGGPSHNEKTLLVSEEVYRPGTQQHLALQEISIDVSETNKPGSFKTLAVAHGQTGVNLAYGFTAATVFINFCVLLSRLELRQLPRISIHGQVVLANTLTRPTLTSVPGLDAVNSDSPSATVTVTTMEDSTKGLVAARTPVINKRGIYAESLCIQLYNRRGQLWDEVRASCVNTFLMEIKCILYYHPLDDLLENQRLAGDVRTDRKNCPEYTSCKEFPQTKDFFGKDPHTIPHTNHAYGTGSAYCTPRRPTFIDEIFAATTERCLKTKEIVVQGGASTSEKELLISAEAFRLAGEEHILTEELSIHVSETNKPGSYKTLATVHGHSEVNLALAFTATTIFVNICFMLSRVQLRQFPRIAIHGQTILANTLTKPRLESDLDYEPMTITVRDVENAAEQSPAPGLHTLFA